jgi:hypothetical protein
MSKEIAKIYNGNICFLSKVNKGSCFIFTFELESKYEENE